MKKQGLKKAPLIHSVIQLRFTTIPEVEKISEVNMSQLHQKMIDQGFPEKIIAKLNQLAISVDTSSSQAKNVKTEMTRHLFRSAGELETIELLSNENVTSLILKSSSYENFKSFYQKFHALLTICLEVFPGLSKTLLKSIELRYVDLIVPNKSHTLSDFVLGGIIPMQLKTLGTNQHLHGFSQRYVTTSVGSQLRVAFEEIPTGSHKALTKILPDDLGEKDPTCGLVIPIQDVWSDIESPTYGILDIQNGKEFQGSPKIDLNSIQTESKALYQDCSNVFWEVITPKAKKLWEIYDVE